MKSTIEEVESRLEEDLSKLRSVEYQSLAAVKERLVPPGYRVHVRLIDKEGRKKRKNASSDSWTPASGEIRIYFEQEASSSRDAKPIRGPEIHDVKAPTMAEAMPSTNPIADLIRSLDRAEGKPGYEFIALKWFRDVVLPAEKFEWVASDSARQATLRQAIDGRLILTSRVQNPKSPQFPVTAIRLNRLLPEVQAMLGTADLSDSGFDPVDIRGERLSTTVLRERR
jgi:hypothetical protein